MVVREDDRLCLLQLHCNSSSTSQPSSLQADHTIHMVRGLIPPGSSPTAATTNTRNSNTTPGAGASGLLGAELPEFQQLQQQVIQNPEKVQEIMDMPFIQNLMNNVDLMHSMAMNNAEIRAIINRNRQLAYVLSNSCDIRQVLTLVRNPGLMCEMKQIFDRVMSNIASSPEGFNILRRMHEILPNTPTMGGGTESHLRSNPFAALSGAQGCGAQTGGGSNSTSTTGSETTIQATLPNASPLPNPWSGTEGSRQTNTGTRSNPTGDARVPGIGGLAGFGIPETGNTFGMPDSAVLNQLLQNPAFSQMMQSLFCNPQYMNQFLGLNPQPRSMLYLNPQLREMIQNPEILCRLYSPEVIQQMMALQRSPSQLMPQHSPHCYVAYA